MLNEVVLMGVRGALAGPGGPCNPERGGRLPSAEGVVGHEEMNEGGRTDA